jgi:hypothetical protein
MSSALRRLLPAALVGFAFLVSAGRPATSHQEPSDTRREDPPKPEKIEARPRGVPQAQWEYKSIAPCSGELVASRIAARLESVLDDEGRQGWELVSAFPLDARTPGGPCYVAVLKRPMLF